MHLGILQCGHVPEEVADRHGAYGALYGAMLAHRGFRQTLWSVVDGEFPPGPDAADAWLISGSRYGAYEDLPWIAPLEDLIRAIRDASRPLVGVCFGHQVIAQALGGTVEKFAGGWSVGAQEYTVGDTTLRANAWHQDQVTVPPPGATLHGTSPSCAHAILAIGPRILTVQPHPEFPDDVMKTLIEVRGAALDPAAIAAATSRLDQPNDARVLADWLADVLEGADATHPLAKVSA